MIAVLVMDLKTETLFIVMPRHCDIDGIDTGDEWRRRQAGRQAAGETDSRPLQRRWWVKNVLLATAHNLFSTTVSGCVFVLEQVQLSGFIFWNKNYISCVPREGQRETYTERGSWANSRHPSTPVLWLCIHKLTCCYNILPHPLPQHQSHPPQGM